jgi:calpain
MRDSNFISFHLQIAGDLPDIRAPTPERSAIEQLFSDIAGPEQEVGWMELKRILDHSMRDGE